MDNELVVQMLAEADTALAIADARMLAAVEVLGNTVYFDTVKEKIRALSVSLHGMKARTHHLSEQTENAYQCWATEPDTQGAGERWNAEDIE